MVGPLGVLVERVLVQRDLCRPPIPMLRVKKGSYYVADCRSVAEVAQLVALAEPGASCSVSGRLRPGEP